MWPLPIGHIQRPQSTSLKMPPRIYVFSDGFRNPVSGSGNFSMTFHMDKDELQLIKQTPLLKTQSSRCVTF